MTSLHLRAWRDHILPLWLTRQARSVIDKTIACHKLKGTDRRLLNFRCKICDRWRLGLTCLSGKTRQWVAILLLIECNLSWLGLNSNATILWAKFSHDRGHPDSWYPSSLKFLASLCFHIKCSTRQCVNKLFSESTVC